MFNGDEILPDPPTRFPSRGIELCGVVEAMFSYNTMFSVHGDVAFADRSEQIAFNALPATWASPTGGDMWAHQCVASPLLAQNDACVNSARCVSPTCCSGANAFRAAIRCDMCCSFHVPPS